MVTNFQAAMLYKFLASPVANELTMSLKGNLAVQRNLRGLKDFFESVVELEGKYKLPSEGYQEFERRKNELIMKHALKDEEGKPIQAAGGLRISNVEGFNKDMNDLMEASKEIIEEHQNKLREWEEFAAAEVDIPIIKIGEADIKFDKISKADFESLVVMIEGLDLGEVEEVEEDEKEPEEDLEKIEEDLKKE
jgi:hypothetical protein